MPADSQDLRDDEYEASKADSETHVHIPDLPLILRIALLALGWLVIVLGLAGLLLPGLQGILLLILSGYIASTGLSIVFGKDTQINGVIRKGVFRFVRHPIYLSEIILYFGLLIMNLSLAATGVWIAGIIFLHYVSRHEERLLLEKYGKEYEEYMKEVPMWFPRLIR